MIFSIFQKNLFFGYSWSTRKPHLLIVLVWDETASWTARSKTGNRHLSSALLLFTVPEAVFSHTKTRSRDQLCCSFSVLLLAVPENQFHPVLASLGTGAPIAFVFKFYKEKEKKYVFNKNIVQYFV